jgi:hypothetical protein
VSWLVIVAFASVTLTAEARAGGSGGTAAEARVVEGCMVYCQEGKWSDRSAGGPGAADAVAAGTVVSCTSTLTWDRGLLIAVGAAVVSLAAAVVDVVDDVVFLKGCGAWKTTGASVGRGKGTPSVSLQ